MTPYLILSWNPLEPEADMRARSVRAALDARVPAWRLVVDRPGQMIATGSNGTAILIPHQRSINVIVGDVFPRGAGEASVEHLLTSAVSFGDFCNQLASHHWGAYIAIQLKDGGDFSLFRDPVGMRDGIGWTASGVRIFASEEEPWLAHAPPENIAVDWHRVAQLLLDSGTLAEITPIIGINTIPAGALVESNGGPSSVQRLWFPHRFYDDKRGHKVEAATLRQTVLKCVEAWATRYPNNILEISGGFDSAVVAASSSGIARGINFFTNQFSGDERRYARAVAERRQIPLDEIFMPVGALSEADFEDLPIGVRPGLGSATLFHDRLLTEAALGNHADALFTGHGGDSVFFQHPTAMIAADRSFPRWNAAAYPTLAKWSRESIWTVAGYAFHLPMWRESHRAENDAIVNLPISEAARAGTSDWVGAIDQYPPAKRTQLAGIASDRSSIGPSWRSRALTVVHPLLSQPIVEYAIAADTFALTEGRRDRALARRAFAPMLPDLVVDRKGKGRLALYFGQCLCASIPFLRAFLLDGVLVQHGVLDRARLDPMLDANYLMRFDCYVKLRSALVMEHWARVWQNRIDAIQNVGSSRRATASM